MFQRYRVRAEGPGFTVYDHWTGEPVVLALTPQTEMAEPDAAELAELLNRRSAAGDRTVRQ